MHTPEAWPRCPEAAQFFETQFRTFAADNPLLETLAARFQNTGVNILSLVDHWIFPDTPGLPAKIAAMGLVEETLPEGDRIWKHPGARLPGVRFKSKRTTPCLALLVENIPHFAQANGLAIEACHGEDDSAYQCGHLTLPAGELMPVVRRGYAGFAPGSLSETDHVSLTEVRTCFASRDRSGSETEVQARTLALVEKAISLLGKDRATHEFFAAERDYYMARNAAARWQYHRQQEIGIGWANHDHHTYRSSRSGFRALIHLFVTLGFEIREKFYAGDEAGWGAQVLEHPVSRIIIFADVDLAPHELAIEFAQQELTPRDALGTIGLWCALHTSSVAEAGMHHLECEFDYARVHANLEAAGFPVMTPFTDLPMLKQAFTVAENWQIPSERLQPLLSRQLLTTEQAEKFRTQGANGSHLEILQRWEGFKGFNKTGVSAIIRETDARN